MSKFSLDEFVKTWQLSTTVRQVADKLGASPAYIYQLARKLQRRGVKLKRHDSGRVVDVDALNKLIASL